MLSLAIWRKISQNRILAQFNSNLNTSINFLVKSQWEKTIDHYRFESGREWSQQVQKINSKKMFNKILSFTIGLFVGLYINNPPHPNNVPVLAKFFCFTLNLGLISLAVYICLSILRYLIQCLDWKSLKRGMPNYFSSHFNPEIYYHIYIFLFERFILYLAIDTVFHPSGIIQNGRGKFFSSKSHV